MKDERMTGAAGHYALYQSHYQRMGNALPSEQIFAPALQADFWKPWMKGLGKDARILDCGCGTGHQLYALQAFGFHNLHGIDIVESSLQIAQSELGDQVRLERIDAFDYLPRHAGAFDVIILNDVLEHVPRERVVGLLRLIHTALRPGGIVHVRVPNMASLLASYSMYLDFTHVSGFTEFSLMEVLELGGFDRIRLVPGRPALFWAAAHPGRMIKRVARRTVHWANRALHRVVYFLRTQQPVPQEVGYNVEMYATKPTA